MNYICQAEKPGFHTDLPDPGIVKFFDEHFKKEYFIEFDYNSIGLAPKRGNRAYDSRVRRRVWEIENRLKDITYIDEKKELSNLVHIVLTYPSDVESWERFSQDTKRFLDSMRKDKRIGMTDYIITLEATKKGVAHAHILMSTELPLKYVKTRRYNPQTRKSTPYGKIADSSFVEAIQSRWKYINSVEACYSTGASYYIFKYVVKGFSDVKRIYQKYKKGTWLTDKEYKKLIGLYSLVKYNKRAFRASRGYKRQLKPPEVQPLDPKLYKAGGCKPGVTCEVCEQKCFMSLVIHEAQLRKTTLTAFYDFDRIQKYVFKNQVLPSDVIKSFKYRGTGWRNDLWRGAELYDVEIYYRKEDHNE